MYRFQGSLDPSHHLSSQRVVYGWAIDVMAVLLWLRCKSNNLGGITIGAFGWEVTYLYVMYD